MSDVQSAADRLRTTDPTNLFYWRSDAPNQDARVLASAYLAEHDPTPIDEAWLRSVGFVPGEHFDLRLTFRKEYGEDVAKFELVCGDVPNLPDCGWEIWCQSIEVEREGALLPCEPATRGDLRRLCESLGIPLTP